MKTATRTKLTLAAALATTAMALTTSFTAEAKLATNGPQLTGIAAGNLQEPRVNAVTLASGECIALR